MKLDTILAYYLLMVLDILQPTRVTSSSATLIDNILKNNLETCSSGGNITTSISDHFPQFCQLDIFDKNDKSKEVKYGRSYKNFNQDEFEHELREIKWTELFLGKTSEDCYNIFFNCIEKLLDEMAPIRRLSKKEINLLKRPWITNGLLKSMHDRDLTHSNFVKENDPEAKGELFKMYKRKRNLVKILIRRSKQDYYVAYFEENKSNIKKTWDGIRNIVNIFKNSRVSPVQINYKNEVKTSKDDMAGALNDFFVNIGNMVEEKIPLVILLLKIIWVNAI